MKRQSTVPLNGNAAAGDRPAYRALDWLSGIAWSALSGCSAKGNGLLTDQRPRATRERRS